MFVPEDRFSSIHILGNKYWTIMWREGLMLFPIQILLKFSKKVIPRTDGNKSYSSKGNLLTTRYK